MTVTTCEIRSAIDWSAVCFIAAIYTIRSLVTSQLNIDALTICTGKLAIFAWWQATGFIGFVTAIATILKAVATTDERDTLAIRAGKLRVITDNRTTSVLVPTISTIHCTITAWDTTTIVSAWRCAVRTGTSGIAMVWALASINTDFNSIALADCTEGRVECILVRAYGLGFTGTLFRNINACTAS